MKSFQKWVIMWVLMPFGTFMLGASVKKIIDSYFPVVSKTANDLTDTFVKKV